MFLLKKTKMTQKKMKKMLEANAFGLARGLCRRKAKPPLRNVCRSAGGAG